MRSRTLLLLLCMTLAACASAPPAQPPLHLFQDDLFAAPSQRISADDVFAVTDAMKRYLHTEIAGELRVKGRRQGLIDALYSKGQLKLDYDSAMTRNAAQAFDARAGNCLSLVIMTAALAKELGLDVRYQSAVIDEIWSRSGNLYLLHGHVNVTLRTRNDFSVRYDANELLTIDFLPPQDLRGLRTLEIEEQTVVAMYMNNRAAEALVGGRQDDAYWWAREAIRQSPAFLSAYNTLGVVYLRRGSLSKAEQVLRHVLEREAGNTRALANLALILDKQGRAAESALLHRELARIERHAPFHFFQLGVSAMQTGDFKQARDFFAKEVERSPYYHEFHFWLGVAHFRLGEIEQARRELTLALDNSTTRSDHDLYAAKLDRLAPQRHP